MDDDTITSLDTSMCSPAGGLLGVRGTGVLGSWRFGPKDLHADQTKKHDEISNYETSPL